MFESLLNIGWSAFGFKWTVIWIFILRRELDVCFGECDDFVVNENTPICGIEIDWFIW